MADYGAEFIGPNGHVIVDGKYRNHGLRDVGTMAVQQNDGYSSTTNSLAMPTHTGVPLVLIQPGSIFTSGVSVDQGTNQIRFITEQSGTVGYAFYDGQGNLYDSGPWGMQVFNANGDLVVDSRHRALVVRDYLTLPQFPLYGTVETANHVSVPNAYYALTGLTGLQIDGHGNPQAVQEAPGYLPCLRQVANNRIEYKLGCMQWFPDQPYDELSLPTVNSILVCEVR